MLKANRLPFRPVAHSKTRDKKSVSIFLEKPLPHQTLDNRYLSFSIDISVLAGGFWWEGAQNSSKGLGTVRVPALDLEQSKLNKLISALGPAFLRVGGSEADKLHYFSAPEHQPEALVLTKSMWNDLHALCKRHDLDLMFTFKYGLFRRNLHGNWPAQESLELLQYSKEQNQHIAICELGNELNAYWAFHGLRSQPSAKKLAQDYDAFIRMVREVSPESRIAGPGSAFWPRVGETIRPISNITQPLLSNMKEKLDIVDWHFYPFQSTRSPIRTRAATVDNLLSFRSYYDYEKYLSRLKKWRDQYQPQAELWTGETGSAQCGGQAQLSDRFVSSFWWADQLGRGALLGQKVMVRQSLIGGDYALINRSTLKPNPDYWVSWLWKKLMGNDVYLVKSSAPDVLVYCHSAKKEGKCTLLIINLTVSPKMVNCHGFGAKKRRFEITAENLTSNKIRINGIVPKFKGGKVKLKDFPKLSKLNLISPYSINFWCFTL